tara:strand:+ start:412 stop:849 length:438 start_codon:yes stop_codon:yes gene_type:complete
MAFNYKVGLHNVGSYQVSGVPFASGSIDCAGAVTKIQFPSVTSWVQIYNGGGTVTLQAGFSEGGIVDGNPTLGQDRFFEIHKSSSSGILPLKLTELYLLGGVAGKTSVVAGLTFIHTASINNAQVSPNKSSTDTTHTNWTGSAGV